MAIEDIAILVVAAGRGARAGAGLPKQYRVLAGQRLLTHTLRAMLRAIPSGPLLCAINPDDRALYDACIADLSAAERARIMPPAAGGATRQQSVRAGLEQLAQQSQAKKYVAIHDAARPFASDLLVQNVIRAAREFGAAIPGLTLTDTIKQVDTSGSIVASPNRDVLRGVQTPQVFELKLIHAAHVKASAQSRDDLTDDASVATFAGYDVHVVDGDIANLKITTEADLANAQTRLAPPLTDIRMGQGYDVHAFGPGDHVWLGGVQIPHGFGLVGHSDADVLMHALTDAIYGALADGDIGSHFPPSDQQWKGAASDIFLRHAVGRVAERGGRITHLDGTVVCEEPKVGPHRDAIRARLAAITGLDLDRIAIKATTSERLGFTGRKEGIAAFGLATIRLPESNT